MSQVCLRNRLLIAFISALILISCTGNFGKKVTFESTKGEVFYKGDGITDADAKATGNFLKKEKFFMADDKVRSVQIIKTGDRIQARFVIDEKGLAEVKNADQLFEIIGAKMSAEVFNDSPVDIIYTDKTFKDKKILTYNPKVLESESSRIAKEIKLMKRRDFNNNTVYYTANVKEKDMDVFFKYLRDSGFFTESGSADLIVNQAGDGSVRIRFPVKNDFNTDEGMQKIEAFAKVLKTDMFESIPLEFEALDEDMKLIRAFSYQ